MPFLEHGTNSIEVTPGELLVGSGAQATWRVLNSDLAARHFTIRLAADGNAMLRPYSPNTIVVVNGLAATQQGTALTAGDVIAAGSARFLYLDSLEGERPNLEEGDDRAAYLVDERERRAYPLVKRTITIGRDVGSAIPIRDPAVSRFHADIRGEAGQFVLYSMGSAGTHVNNHRVGAPKMLEEGDLIRIGDTTFRFTRAALPEGVRVAKLGEHDDDAMARRPTTTDAGAIRVSDEGSTTRRSGLMAIVVVGVLLLAAAAWFVLSG